MVDSSDYQWPVVTVCICTYDRLFEFKQTVGALHEKLVYPNLRWHIADDGSPVEVLDEIGEFMTGLGYDAVVTSTPREGWGANVNFALEQIESDLVLFTEDDYVLLSTLDLKPFVALLETYQGVGMVRFGISGHDGMQAVLREYDIPKNMLPDFSEAHGQGSTAGGKLNAWELDLAPHDSWGAFGFFRYSNRPHLKHRRFHEVYGAYAEGLPLASTEEEFNHRITVKNDRARRATQAHLKEPVICPSIVVPCSWTFWHFDHIGKSRQGTEEDVHGMG